MYSQSDIEKIKELILSHIDNAEDIILFGSYAKGIATQKSDMDLAVLTGSFIERTEKLKILTSIRRAFAKNGFDADILIKEKNLFIKESSLPTISRTIQQEGKFIWKKA